MKGNFVKLGNIMSTDITIWLIDHVENITLKVQMLVNTDPHYKGNNNISGLPEICFLMHLQYLPVVIIYNFFFTSDFPLIL